MAAALKTLLPVAGIGGVGAAGGYYLLSDSSTIKDKLKEELRGQPRRILSSDASAEWSEWKKVYKASSSKISGVSSEEDLPKWCMNTLGQKFEQSKYALAKEWCVIDTSTLKGTLSLQGVNLIPESGNGIDQKFKDAWKKVNSEKNSAGQLAISDDSVIGSSVSDENKGGPELQKWCTSRYSWAMYKLEARNDLEKVKKWCSEGAGVAAQAQ
ncbi:hypothetical protein HF1_13140 [Mycoplasma haemofelis str. Langford 1]|uniref:Uncharacterized protein n=1 Tax=Mycoplasma haemofelis (strain Langford 1) TaxID=941640 RepID=E8ZJK1_MYCHL|nr:hypothetical protein [Mycoplasma haemofelis]CBY93322.1 hypothetical protein HF1_13140 [Mycoplasma haemofelis str. Langford 1]